MDLGEGSGAGTEEGGRGAPVVGALGGEGTGRQGGGGGRGGMGVGGVEEAHWGVGAKGYAGEEGLREAGREGKGP